MFARFTAAALLASYFAAPIAAQSTLTTSLFILEADPQPLVASVVGVDHGATTYAIQCKPGTDGNECGFPQPWLMTYGPTFYEARTTETGILTVSERCFFADTTSAVCTLSLGGSGANYQGETSQTLLGSDITSLPVVITAGVEKLSGASATTTATGASAATGSSTVTGASSSNTGMAVAAVDARRSALLATLVGMAVAVFAI